MKTKNTKNAMVGCVSLLLAALALAGCPGTESPGTESPGKESQKDKSGYPVSGTVTIIPAVADLTAVELILLKSEEPVGDPIHPDETGAFTFTDVEAAETDDYVVMATLTGYVEVVTENFSVTKAVTLPGLTLRPPLPTLSTAAAEEADKITLTFDKAVVITGTAGITAETKLVTNVQNDTLTAASYLKVSDTEWEITLNRAITLAEVIVTVKYDASSNTIGEAGSERYLTSFSKGVTLEFTVSGGAFEVSHTQVLVRDYGIMSMQFFYVTFNQDIDISTMNRNAWTLTGSISGVLSWQGSAFGTVPNNPNQATIAIARKPDQNETLTLSYDKTVNAATATDGSVLESFTSVPITTVTFENP